MLAIQQMKIKKLELLIEAFFRLGGQINSKNFL
jgi:hypothetical protein